MSLVGMSLVGMSLVAVSLVTMSLVAVSLVAVSRVTLSLVNCCHYGTSNIYITSLFSLFTVHGMWSLWGLWTDCSSTCAGGTRSRLRTCDNPLPSLGGAPCDGLPEDKELCNMNMGCPGKSTVRIERT